MPGRNQDLIDTLIRAGYLKTLLYIEAFKNVKRQDFVLENSKDEAYSNFPLSIGYGQTISQPATVAFMLELLKPKPGQNILDIGAGSGWQTALLSYIVGAAGNVVAIERIKELKEFAFNNISKYNFKRTKVLLGDGIEGYQKLAPYDGIIVAAAAHKSVPEQFFKQLKQEGRLIIPSGDKEQSILVIDKISEDKCDQKEYPGFIFVPLVGA